MNLVTIEFESDANITSLLYKPNYFIDYFTSSNKLIENGKLSTISLIKQYSFIHIGAVMS